MSTTKGGKSKGEGFRPTSPHGEKRGKCKEGEEAAGQLGNKFYSPLHWERSQLCVSFANATNAGEG